MAVLKQYHNCKPLSDDEPTFYDGVSFEFSNGTGSTIWLALESNKEIQLNKFGFPDELTSYSYGSGVYDPETVVMFRPNEKKTIWVTAEGCGVDNVKCDGSEGREIVIVRNDIDSTPLQYTFEKYGYCEAVCCVEEEPECCEETCDNGTICKATCNTCEPNPCE